MRGAACSCSGWNCPRQLPGAWQGGTVQGARAGECPSPWRHVAAGGGLTPVPQGPEPAAGPRVFQTAVLPGGDRGWAGWGWRPLRSAIGVSSQRTGSRATCLTSLGLCCRTGVPAACSRPQTPPSPVASMLPVPGPPLPPGQSPGPAAAVLSGLPMLTLGGLSRPALSQVGRPGALGPALAVSSPLWAGGVWVLAVAPAGPAPGNQSPSPMRQDTLACLGLPSEPVATGSGAFPCAGLSCGRAELEGSCSMGCAGPWAGGCGPEALGAWAPHPGAPRAGGSPGPSLNLTDLGVGCGEVEAVTA